MIQKRKRAKYDYDPAESENSDTNKQTPDCRKGDEDHSLKPQIDQFKTGQRGKVRSQAQQQNIDCAKEYDVSFFCSADHAHPIAFAFTSKPVNNNQYDGHQRHKQYGGIRRQHFKQTAFDRFPCSRNIVIVNAFIG